MTDKSHAVEIGVNYLISKQENSYKHIRLYTDKKRHELCLEFPNCYSNSQWTRTCSKLLLFSISRFDLMAAKITETKAAVDCLWKCYQVSFDFSRLSYFRSE